MGGLIIISIIFGWFFIAKKLAVFFSKNIQNIVFKKVFQVLLVTLTFLAPVADEIAGGFQFRELCKAEAVAVYDEAKVRGKEVYSKPLITKHFANTILPTDKKIWTYEDIKTGEVIISFTVLHSSGGWLSRGINFNSVDHPYTFDGICGREFRQFFFQTLKVKSLN